MLALRFAPRKQLNFLDLPSELIGKVFYCLVAVNGLSNAVAARLVCRTFDAEILHAAWVNRCLESEANRRIYGAPKLVAYYIHAQTLADYNHHFAATRLIYETLDVIQRTNSSCLSTIHDIIRETCRVIAEHNTRLYHDRIVGSEVLPSFVTAQTPIENALALCLGLGLSSVVQELVDQLETVSGSLTYFGNPLMLVAGDQDPSLASAYLGVPLELSTPKRIAFLSSISRGGESPRGLRKRRRKIDTKSYDNAIRHAIQYGTCEVLNVISAAAVEDGAFPGTKLGVSVGDPPRVEWKLRQLGDFILKHAVEANRCDMVRLAFEHGANQGTIKVWSGQNTHQMLAAQRGRPEMLFMLYDLLPELNWAALLPTAIDQGDTMIVKWCIAALVKFSTFNSTLGQYEIAIEHTLVKDLDTKKAALVRFLLANPANSLAGLNIEDDTTESPGTWKETRSDADEQHVYPRTEFVHLKFR